MFTKRSASENSSSRNWFDIATITYYCDVPDQFERETQERQPTLRAEGVIFPGKIMMPRFMAFSSKMLRSLCGIGWICEPWDLLSLMNLLSHGFDTNAPFISEKHENLVGWVIIGGCKEVELVPTTNRGRASMVRIREKK